MTGQIYKSNMENKDDIHSKGALGLILYAISFPPNRENTEWTKELEDHYLRCYGEKKLRLIAKSIRHYFNSKDMDLSEVIPLDVSVHEKEKFLKFILEGLKKSGLSD